MVYMDDITIYSKYARDHIKHLKKMFLKCRKFGISLNPKKSIFSMQEGKLLGHIISKDGIKIDPDKVKAIQKVEIPRNKRIFSLLLGK